LAGELVSPAGYRLKVKERLTFDAGALQLESYGYEVSRDREQLYWYDSQPHPHEPTLKATDLHHKHIPPPDTKHHRLPAPGLSFARPNLPILIQEIENLLATP